MRRGSLLVSVLFLACQPSTQIAMSGSDLTSEPAGPKKVRAREGGPGDAKTDLVLVGGNRPRGEPSATVGSQFPSVDTRRQYSPRSEKGLGADGRALRCKRGFATTAEID